MRGSLPAIRVAGLEPATVEEMEVAGSASAAM